jgi:uridine kinase
MPNVRPLVIGFAGGSGCGKTHLAHEIRDAAGQENVSVLSMDQYFSEIDLAVTDPSQVNFDHPAHLDFDQMIADVSALKRGETVATPQYDYGTMRRKAEPRVVKPGKVVIIEGLFVLAEPLVRLCDLTCYLDVDTDERLLGRILRDTRERAATIEQVVDRYQRFVRPSHKVFVSPTRENADIVVDFTYRRTLFTKLVSYLIRDRIEKGMDPDALVAELRGVAFSAGANLRNGYMPFSTNILMLAKAYPESVLPDGAAEAPLSSPAMSHFEALLE